VRDDRARGLLAVPRAVAPEALGQDPQLLERVVRGQPVVVPPVEPVVDEAGGA
jgi:hypothetical protein